VAAGHISKWCDLSMWCNLDFWDGIVHAKKMPAFSRGMWKTLTHNTGRPGLTYPLSANLWPE
jgi:hypothetical protein